MDFDNSFIPLEPAEQFLDSNVIDAQYYVLFFASRKKRRCNNMTNKSQHKIDFCLNCKL